MSDKFAISEITDIKFIIPKFRTVKENVPHNIKVTKKEFESFMSHNFQHIKESYVSTPSDSYIVKDTYGNIIASMNYYIEETYYINPELLKLGIEKKKYIENEYEKVGEEVINMGSVKPYSFDNA